MFYVYILKCKDGSLYTGWTVHIQKRLNAHNKGTASKYTRSRRPVHVMYIEEFESKVQAMQREYEIKTWTREKKQQLITKDPYDKTLRDCTET